ncbi:MAG: polynucleotide adenylyltransferase PcnB, partial [Spirochaetaceae bacterium]|nr:polynucleotide adenylyltransferase PcnB [Spirochaetaceae bacterium]
KAVVYTQNEHGIDLSDVDSEAVFIIERLQANGYETYIVGGAVRDLILGKKPKDFDIASAASPARIKKIFRNARIIGHRFRLVHVYFGPRIYEVSTFRSIKDGPTSNTFGTIEEDVLRRDYTLNALFYDPLKQIVVDYVGGMKDIRSRKIRPIIPLSRIFTDDPVRMIRAVKYSAATGFALPLALKWKIKKYRSLLRDVSPSRLTEEIFKIIHSSQAAAIVENLELFGLYQYLQPRASELFQTRNGFKLRYLATMKSLNQEGFQNRLGEAMSGLVRDYLEDEADWNDESAESPALPSERYKEAFIAARKFVLPMNPPRMELDHAIRLLFAEHGVVIKKVRFPERRPRRAAGRREHEADEESPPPEKEQAPRKRRRRRSHRQENPPITEE